MWAGLAELVEQVFAEFGAARGDWILELHAQDGNLRRWRLQRSGGRTDLEALAEELLERASAAKS